MPRDEDALRVLARATGLATTAADLVELWRRTQHAVRSLHERLFYRPLLSAVAALPDGASLTSEQAEARLAAIGFTDPAGALRHIAALTGGVSRRASIQRNLLPVMLQWFAEGADPDYGLLDVPPPLRRPRRGVLVPAHAARLLGSGPTAHCGAVQLSLRRASCSSGSPRPRRGSSTTRSCAPARLDLLLEEAAATVARHANDPDAAAAALRTARRREVLRLALAAILGLVSVEELGRALSDVTTAILTGVLAIAHRWGDGIEFGIIAMGRYGGQELGFGSDADIMYVYRPAGVDPEEAQRRAEAIVHELARLTEDLRLPLDLDIGLRPEGKNGAIVRSLDSYRAYYERWSLTWEAQALLRARGVVGDAELLAAFEDLADEVRYPESVSPADVREIKRIKARVEAERLPQAADPARHLKLGRGSLSDVEWFVQLLQLQNAASVPELRTTSTLRALDAAVAANLIPEVDAARLRAAWLIASRARSAITLATAKTTDVLPTDRQALERVSRVLEYPPGSASRLEEDYLRTTRLARQVFERRFYGPRNDG